MTGRVSPGRVGGLWLISSRKSCRARVMCGASGWSSGTVMVAGVLGERRAKVLASRMLAGFADSPHPGG